MAVFDVNYKISVCTMFAPAGPEGKMHLYTDVGFIGLGDNKYIETMSLQQLTDNSLRWCSMPGGKHSSMSIERLNEVKAALQEEIDRIDVILFEAAMGR